MLGWLLGLAADLVAFALGGDISHERRAQHIATARLYGSIAAIFAGGLAGILAIFAIGDRLDETAQATFTSTAGLAYLLALVVALVAYIRRVRGRR